MKTNEILKSLADLQSNLNQIDSAKQQVLKILNSSAELAEVVSSYQSSFQALTTNIQQMVDKIKELNVNILSDLQKHTDNFRVEVSKLNEFTQSLAAIHQSLEAAQNQADANKHIIVSQLDQIAADIRTSNQTIHEEHLTKFSELAAAIKVNRIMQMCGVVVTIAAVAGLFWFNILGKFQ